MAILLLGRSSTFRDGGVLSWDAGTDYPPDTTSFYMQIKTNGDYVVNATHGTNQDKIFVRSSGSWNTINYPNDVSNAFLHL